MSAAPALTAELRGEVLALEDDLRARVDALPDTQRQWREEYVEARTAERTSASWEAWRDERVTLAAVAWVLTTVFVRFCEDNGLVGPVWISHAGGRSREAADGQAEFLRETARINPDVTDREWLLEAVRHLAGLPATAGLVDATSPMWLVSPSGDAAGRLLTFWRARDDDGALLRDLADAGLDTRFLGDLYQDISEAARKRYALLQTPVFVEEFILDRTLEPALAERPLEGFKAIDPTCGSGHFLLGIFARLLDRWHAHAPGMDERERVQAALDAVHGVDLNPYAVSVARFRLTVAALGACGMTSLEGAPAFKYHLAAGDSLLHGLDQDELELGADLSTDRVAANFAYATENLADLKRILRNGQYDCVVGNPPYITVSDPALNKLYRERYATCHRQYALTVPFMERFFSLAKSGDRAGWAGQITSNSFMKREFGSKLIEEFLPTKDLRLVADTSGAYIPGHGTPTVVVVGRNTQSGAATVRVVQGVRGEPGRPQEPSRGLVWSSILELIDHAGESDQWVTVVDASRALLAKHPWSLQGGGAAGLLEVIEAASMTVVASAVALPIGRSIRAGADEAFILPLHATRSAEFTNDARPLLLGEDVRDWVASPSAQILYPYVYGAAELYDGGLSRELWANRALLAARRTFQGDMADSGLAWWEYMQHTWSPYRTPLSITFAFVATHNHFVLDRGGKVFKQSAPVIKLPEGASEEDHLALLGVLNSSTACFWLKQNSHNKGNGGIGGGIGDEAWEPRYEFTGTTLQDFPLPSALPLNRGTTVDRLAHQLSTHAPSSVGEVGVPSRSSLDAAREASYRLRAQLIAVQEELDWETYGLFDLLDDDSVSTSPTADTDLPELALGQRAFEIVLARKLAAGEEDTAWFARHGSTPITEIPAYWPAAYRDLVQRRIDLIVTHPFIRLLEKPEHKRRWATEPWEKQEERALRRWLLDRLEDERFWRDSHGRPTPKSVAVLADEVARDDDLVSVLALWEGRPDVSVTASLERLLAKEAVPYLAAYRYKEPGLRKRAAWEHTWDLQRREDDGTYKPTSVEHGGDGPIPVPPKYTTADFTRVEYWSHRGKLDVPKERFVLYPAAGRETDATAVLGWAGWDHADQALALATLLQERQRDGWADDRLVPLVAGLAEVLPWVQQWHDQPVDLYGGTSPADFFAEQLEQRMSQVGATTETLKAWRPAPTRRGRKKTT